MDPDARASQPMSGQSPSPALGPGGEPGRGAVRPRLAEAATDLPPQAGVSPSVITGLARLGEFLTVTAIGAALTLGYIPPSITLSPAYLVAIPGAALMTVIAFDGLGLYRIGAFRAVFASGLRMAGAYALVFLLMMAAVFFLKLEGVFSRVVFGGWFVLGLVALFAGRAGLGMLVRSMTRRGALDRRTAVVGGGDAAEALIAMLTADADSDIRIIGVFDERTDDRSPDLVGGYPKLGAVDDLITYARNARLDLVIFALPVTAEARILSMLRKLWVLPVDIRLAAHMQKLRFRPRNYSYIGALPMFDVADKPFGAWDVLAKAAFDRVMGALLLILASPLMLMVALAVKLDSRGPVLFRQKRYGFNNQMIEVYKFRSMHVGTLDATASKLVTKDDPRVTRVGRFIRRASLDELPQLFNVVVTGNLSLVGPRPHAVHAKAEDRLYDEVVDGYFARHKVKPGITGWAQVNGWRGETDTEEKIQKRVEYDLHYIENWSILFDLYILALTPISVVRGENAY